MVFIFILCHDLSVLLRPLTDKFGDLLRGVLLVSPCVIKTAFCFVCETERRFILPKEPENSCGALYESGKSRGRYNSLFSASFSRLVSLG